jgi:hypothetical protein
MRARSMDWFSPYTERHSATPSETGMEAWVTTQCTTQVKAVNCEVGLTIIWVAELRQNVHRLLARCKMV